MIRIKKKSVNEYFVDFIEYIFCFLMVIISTSIWMRFGIGYEYRNYIRLILGLLTFIIIVFKSKKLGIIAIKKNFLGWFLFFTVCFFSSFFSRYVSLLSILAIWFPIVCYLTLAFSLDRESVNEIFQKLVNVIFIIAIISLLFYVFGSLLGLIKPLGSLEYSWSNMRQAKNYYYIYFEPLNQISDSILIGLPKNCGIFTEGTMFGFILAIAYMLEDFSTNKRTYVKIILAITILTTISTMSIIVLVIYELGRQLFIRRESINARIFKWILMPELFVVVCFFVIVLIFNKQSTGSYGVRYDHIINCFDTFVNNMPFGLGYGGTNALEGTFYYNQGLSVGIPYFLALGGLGALLILTIPFICFCYKSFKEGNWTNIVFGCCFILAFFFTNVMENSTLPWFILTVVFIGDSTNSRSYYKTDKIIPNVVYAQQATKNS